MVLNISIACPSGPSIQTVSVKILNTLNYPILVGYFGVEKIKILGAVLIFSIAMDADNSFYVKFIATKVPTFFWYIISDLAMVCG